MPIDVDITIGPSDVVSVATTTTNQLISAAPCAFVGWSLRETTGGAAAVVEFTSGGNPIGEVSLTAGGSSTSKLSDNGVYVRSDVTLIVISGSVRGAVYIREYT